MGDYINNNVMMKNLHGLTKSWTDKTKWEQAKLPEGEIMALMFNYQLTPSIMPAPKSTLDLVSPVVKYVCKL